MIFFGDLENFDFCYFYISILIVYYIFTFLLVFSLFSLAFGCYSLFFHTHSIFFASILSSLSISIGPYQEEPNRKSKFRGEEWSGA